MSLQVLCLGDSLTYGFAMPRAQIWTALCAAQVGADFCNLAVNGNTTGGMLAALPGALAAQAPDAVFLMGGTNDILYGGDLPGAKANMGAMLHLAVAAGATPLIGLPIPPHQPVRADWAALFPADAPALLADYLDWLRQFAAAFHIPVVDFAGEFLRRAARRGLAPAACYLDDGLHPSSSSHQVMAGIAADALMRLEHRR